MVLAKPAASDSLKETRDKDSSLAAALKTAFFSQVPPKGVISCLNMQSRVLPILSKRPEIRIPAWRQLSQRWFLRKPSVSESLKETRDKDSSLAAAVKRWFWESRLLPILSKRPEIRIPAWRQLSKRWFCESRALPILSKRSDSKTVVLAKPAISGSLKETRDKLPASRQLSNRRFSTRCLPNVLFCA